MPFADSYRSVKLEHGERIDQIKNLTQQQWATACTKLGLFVSRSNGKGSHIAVYKSATCLPSDSTSLVLTITQNIYPNIQRDFVKKVVGYGISSGLYAEGDVWAALGVV